MDNYTSGVSTDCSPSSSFALTGKVMLSSVVILFTVVAVIVFLHSYARWLLRRDRSRRRRSRGRGRTRTQSDPDRVAALDAGVDFGLDFSILKSLPTFVYSKAADGPTLECAVCLSEFEEDEKGRVLPECDHCFHNDCIEMWFHSHSNCPLCRAPVHLHVPSPAEPVEPPAATGSPRDDTGPSPGTLPLLECPRTPLELVGITVEELPAGASAEDQGCKVMEEAEAGTRERQSSARSPGCRIMSLKRIWSIQQHNL